MDDKLDMAKESVRYRRTWPLMGIYWGRARHPEQPLVKASRPRQAGPT